ncbi:uncharacterized protein BDZ99DRAFT_483019 [Mytilinidion resinicola]|uniref:Xylanolytic transcriptional activator regulatory domain-containing protein n=1 Tax=Mytilinidion resinicola TaxID=574789 RepID=A0A6A6Y2P5_9PEZI|nr:uncharacterized protein BDZ99DRAFT_483019 [Mytilinidion resinicola]KAF2802284.1 hypothetical protein BDZ99DRAFT_483019 [Mytilinidion resinicola]
MPAWRVVWRLIVVPYGADAGIGYMHPTETSALRPLYVRCRSIPSNSSTRNGTMVVHASTSPESSEEQSNGSSGQASQACRPCSQLKRKCERELPSCSLTCEYAPKRKRHGGSTPRSDEAGSTSSTASVASNVKPAGTSQFPDTFFLDPELFQSVTHSELEVAQNVNVSALQLSKADLRTFYEQYSRSTDTWCPIISHKRLAQDVQAAVPTEHPGILLLLLSMRLVSDIPRDDNMATAESTFYKMTRSNLKAMEEASPGSLRVFQSLVLVALYEIGHGIFPAAYLTVGRAARIGLLRGIHDRKNATQLFVKPQTWTYWEEERRTWWAVSILERYINLGPTGLPLATPEPEQGELLPAADADWHRGSIGTNQALYTTGFSPDLDIGPFARLCQASHVLGRVLNHRDCRKDTLSREHVLNEALQLNVTLTALDKHLAHPMDEQHPVEGIKTADVALCTSARMTLYHMYACNIPDVLSERRVEEAAMQTASIEGLKHIIATRAPLLARFVLRQGAELHKASPLVIHCLYDAASECQWFVREGGVIPEAKGTLRVLIEALTLMAKRWCVAGKYLALLNQDSNCQALDLPAFDSGAQNAT